MAGPSALAERLIARACGRDAVSAGEIVTCKVDLAMMHDSGGPRRIKPMLDRLGEAPWDSSRVALVTDHYAPAIDAESAAIVDLTRQWAREQGIAQFFDSEGICHVVLPEHGLIRPGMFVVGGDSHSPTGGAFGAFMVGIGATEMLGVLVRGEIWIKVPRTLLLTWHGRLAAGVTAKDMMLHLCATLGQAAVNYRAVEFAGEAVTSLPMAERMTLCNMTAELGAKTGLIAPDATTLDYLSEVGAPVSAAETAAWQTDLAADYELRRDYDASTLSPQVAAPHSPQASGPVSEHRGVAVDQAYIGSCTGAKLVDLRMAAEILTGRQIAAGTRLLVAPASNRVVEQAKAEGTLATLMEAGAVLLPTGCGACAGYGAGLLGEAEVCISSTARNFKGRMGAASAQIYLGSPYTVAAAAVAGHIVDPREFLP
ncbi:MAG: 3-isopropylmalate dehydratase large subunit [Xanthobacteraceae bacterium]|nr:3-isopropylmalate dehydratase large subunit [Xanthobacteraceae bacterium]